MLNIPNTLTLSRMLMLPVFIWLFFMEGSWGAQAAWIAFGLYILAALTDFADGYLARKLKQITPLGIFLDPISDKIFVAVLLIALVAFGRLPDLWIIPVLIIMARELLVSGLREFLGPHNVKLPVTNLAKWKTAAQMIALGALIIGPYLPHALFGGQILLCFAAAITALTGWDYLKVTLDHMKKMP